MRICWNSHWSWGIRMCISRVIQHWGRCQCQCRSHVCMIRVLIYWGCRKGRCRCYSDDNSDVSSEDSLEDIEV